MTKAFQQVGALHPRKSFFDLSYSKHFAAEAGQLIPVACDEVIPGDVFTIKNSVLVRMNPMIKPVMHALSITIHWYYVPYRILWRNWVMFITRGWSGKKTPTLPLWVPPAFANGRLAQFGLNSLWDYFGFPMWDWSGSRGYCAGPTNECYPLDFPRRAYNFIYNEYYRDPNYQKVIQVDPDLDTDRYIDDIEASTGQPGYTAAEADMNAVKYRNWARDYFSVSMPNQQRGDQLALPVHVDLSNLHLSSTGNVLAAVGSVNSGNLFSDFATPSNKVFAYGASSADANIARDNFNNFISSGISFNPSDLQASTFDVSDLRAVIQAQKFMERSMRAGPRYKEFIKAHFGEDLKDYRVQRPEYIGGYKEGIQISEVVQTSADAYKLNTGDVDQPLGKLGGHGVSASSGFIGKYRVHEHGLIMGVASIMPTPGYSGQGYDRQWLRRNALEFYTPENAHLSEQAVYRAELFATRGSKISDAATPDDLWGYVGVFDEMRCKKDMAVGRFRQPTGVNSPGLDFWHLNRRFDAGDIEDINNHGFPLSSDWLKCNYPNPDGSKLTDRIFSFLTEPGFDCYVMNHMTALRPLPVIAEPGLVDHF